MTHTVQHAGGWAQLHILLALGIMAAYLMVPFTALRSLPLPARTRVFGGLFFATCAITHLALAAGFHGSPWMLLNDGVQLVAVIGFIRCLTRQYEWALRRRREREQQRRRPS